MTICQENKIKSTITKQYLFGNSFELLLSLWFFNWSDSDRLFLNAQIDEERFSGRLIGGRIIRGGDQVGEGEVRGVIERRRWRQEVGVRPERGQVRRDRQEGGRAQVWAAEGGDRRRSDGRRWRSDRRDPTVISRCRLATVCQFLLEFCNKMFQSYSWKLIGMATAVFDSQLSKGFYYWPPKTFPPIAIQVFTTLHRLLSKTHL